MFQGPPSTGLRKPGGTCSGGPSGPVDEESAAPVEDELVEPAWVPVDVPGVGSPVEVPVPFAPGCEPPHAHSKTLIPIIPAQLRDVPMSEQIEHSKHYLRDTTGPRPGSPDLLLGRQTACAQECGAPLCCHGRRTDGPRA